MKVLDRRAALRGLLLVAALGCVGIAAANVRHIQGRLERSTSHALARTLGDGVEIGGRTEVHLFPRPHVLLADVHWGDKDGAARLDVPLLEATQSFGSLLSGHLNFSGIRLIGATARVDADRLVAGLTHAPFGILTHPLPGRVVIDSGTVQIRSVHPSLQGEFSGLNAVLDGIDRNGAATATVQGAWRGTRLTGSARLEPFFDFVLGRETAGTISVRSSVLDASIDGSLHAGIRGGFEGKVAMTTPSLPDLLHLAALPSGLGGFIDRASFSGSGVANPDAITFSDARLAVDGTPFEGSLAWQPNGGHWAWTGTFATDTLDLTRGLAALPTLRDRTGHWSDMPWTTDRLLLGDLDLRVSAARALLGPIVIEDAAFSALCRDGRLEAGFSEARSLDGLIRGRAVAALAGKDMNLRVDLSLSQMDLEPLARAFGASGMAGSASGRLVAEAHGASPRALAEGLAGHGQISVRGGSLPSLPSIADLSALGLDAPAWLRSKVALPFDLLTADLALADNRLHVVDGRVDEPGGQQSFTAEASLGDRSFSLVAMKGPKPTDTATNLAGVWGPTPRVLRVETGAGAVLPGVMLP